ncbi:MAG: hypothetical protein JWM80_2702 [Cyanobacteria bacterium RYN_339]|nr:hypothetical protein [Cyanobacteria bacterium RYN_339]
MRRPLIALLFLLVASGCAKAPTPLGVQARAAAVRAHDASDPALRQVLAKEAPGIDPASLALTFAAPAADGTRTFKAERLGGRQPNTALPARDYAGIGVWDPATGRVVRYMGFPLPTRDLVSPDAEPYVVSQVLDALEERHARDELGFTGLFYKGEKPGQFILAGRTILGQCDPDGCNAIGYGHEFLAIYDQPSDKIVAMEAGGFARDLTDSFL